MRLSVNFIKNFANANQFNYSDEWTIRQGDVVTLYFQFVDLDQDGLRYMVPISGSIVQITLPSPNTNTIKTAFQNATDQSIWSIPILATDLLYTGNIQVSLTLASGNVYQFNVDQALQVEFLNTGAC